MMKEFQHGGEDDHDLFGLVGRLALSNEVHGILGSSVSSDEGDYWFIHVGSDGFASGFSQMRLLGNGSAHIRYAYSTNKAVRLGVIKAAIAKAKKLEAKLVYTNDRKTDDMWPDLDFKKQPSKRLGDFVRWERAL
jgi:hypothetical protein